MTTCSMAHSGPVARPLELGLVDALGDVRAVMRERFGDKVKLKLVAAPSRGGLLRYLVPGLGGAPPAPASLIDADQLIGALEARALWSRYGL
jgi:hypothetical protein